MMRIITGSARGCRLNTLEGEETRPTSERTKEAMFSMIQFEIADRTVLDLFAGSGQLGLEALSRGARHATFLDASRDAVEIIKANAKKTHLFDRCSISAGESSAFLRRASGTYDLVFLDPPYQSGLIIPTLRRLAEGGFLAPGALIMCETSIDTDVNDERVLEYYRVLRENHHGKARITLLATAEAGEV